MISLALIIIFVPILALASVMAGVKYPLILIKNHKISCVDFLNTPLPTDVKTDISWQTICLIMICTMGINISYFFIYPTLHDGFIYSVFSTLCISLIICDFRHNLLPEQLTVLMIVTGLIYALSDYYPSTLEGAIRAGLTAIAIMMTPAVLLRIIKKTEAMGTGDYYFVAGIALWLGNEKVYQFAVMSLLITFGTFIYMRKKQIPLGVGMGLSAILCTIIPQPFITL